MDFLPHDALESLLTAQRLNLLMAELLTQKNTSNENSQTSPLNSNEQTILPAKGSTAGFGLAFTGVDLDHPGKSLWSAHSGPHAKWLNALMRCDQ